MAAIFQFPYLLGLPLLPSRRLIAIDAGSHSIKILLAEKAGKTIRIHREELINLHEEGLLSREEIGPALRAILEEMGDHPVALALPQHLPLSYVLDLTAGSKAVKQMIEAEALKNRDLRDSPVVYDCARLHPFGRHQNSFLVTLCKEEDTVQQIERLSLAKEDVCEVVAPATVLAAAYQTTSNPFGHVLLVDVGATGTLVTVCVGGQAVHSASFPIGGNLFTETIATKKNLSVEEAELIKHSTDLFRGAEELPALAAIVDAWRKELTNVLEMWLRENAELNLSVASFKVILSGGGARQPGLIEYLNRDGGAVFSRWPSTFVNQQTVIGEQFAIAYGTALQALGAGTPSASLLPGALRESWRDRRAHQHFLTGTFAVLVACLLLLVLGTWQKYIAASRKEALLKQAELALGRADETAVLQRELISKYERVRPVLRREQYTLNALDALHSLEHSRSNRNLWYVLFADPGSYFGATTTNVVTNREVLFQPAPAPTNNVIPQRHGFIAELSINQEGEAMRHTLAQVVADLKQVNLFTNVDTLPSDLRREVAYTNVIVPDRHFALLLELAQPELMPSMKAGSPTATTNKPAGGDAEKPSNRPRNR